MRLIPVLVLACTVSAAAADRPESCATSVVTYRNYHEIAVSRDGKDHLARTFDEVSICFTAAGQLSFDLQAIGDGGKECRVQGQAKPRREDVFVFLHRGLRLRFKIDQRKVSIDFDAETYEAEELSELCRNTEELTLRHYSGDLPTNRVREGF